MGCTNALFDALQYGCIVHTDHKCLCVTRGDLRYFLERTRGTIRLYADVLKLRWMRTTDANGLLFDRRYKMKIRSTVGWGWINRVPRSVPSIWRQVRLIWLGVALDRTKYPNLHATRQDRISKRTANEGL